MIAGATKLFLSNEDGATMVEYGFMLLLIALACVATVSLIGPPLRDIFDQVVAGI